MAGESDGGSQAQGASGGDHGAAVNASTRGSGPRSRNPGWVSDQLYCTLQKYAPCASRGKSPRCLPPLSSPAPGAPPAPAPAADQGLLESSAALHGVPSVGISTTTTASSSWRVSFHKACVKTINLVGHRKLLKQLFPPSIMYYDREVHPGVRGMVALTMDDAPCSQRDSSRAMVKDVQKLLDEFGAKATFFLCTDFVEGHEEALVDLLRDGHEVANHCQADRSYADDAAEDFEVALLAAEDVCEDLRSRAAQHGSSGGPSPETVSVQGTAAAPRWFRAPQGSLSGAMRRMLNRHGFTHVLCDCYANDPWISDADFIAQTMLSQAIDGSVAVIHMPERGFREYNLVALREFLSGLQERQLQAVTLGKLHAAAVASPRMPRAKSDPKFLEGEPLAAYHLAHCPDGAFSPDFESMSPRIRERDNSNMTWRVEFHKACWKTLSLVAHRRYLDVMFPATTCYYDQKMYPAVAGHVALSIDDVPCRQRDAGMCMVDEVRKVLDQFGAKATMFLCTDFVPGFEQKVVDLLHDGHEVANHCRADRSYVDDEEEDFEAALLEAERVCEELRSRAGRSRGPATTQGKSRNGVRWFRAPQGRLSGAMEQVINRHGFTHVLSDCYANDPWIADPDFISRTMLSLASDGSLAVIHMPERGFREYNLKALHDLLAGLTERNYKVVTLSELHQLAYSVSPVSKEETTEFESLSSFLSCSDDDDLLSPRASICG